MPLDIPKPMFRTVVANGGPRHATRARAVLASARALRDREMVERRHEERLWSVR